MNIYLWFVVILVAALVVIPGAAWLLGRAQAEYDRVMLLDQPEPPVLPQLPRAGRLDADWWPDPGPFDLPRTLAGYYGPFPADTGPLLLLSEKAAANAALEREIPRLCDEAEAKIPPRWR